MARALINVPKTAKKGEVIYLLPPKPADQLQAGQQSKDASAKVVDPK